MGRKRGVVRDFCVGGEDFWTILYARERFLGTFCEVLNGIFHKRCNNFRFLRTL